MSSSILMFPLTLGLVLGGCAAQGRPVDGGPGRPAAVAPQGSTTVFEPTLPDGGRAIDALIAVASEEGAVHVLRWRAGALSEAGRVRTGRRPHDVGFSPDGRIAYITHEGEGYIATIDTRSWQAGPRLDIGAPQHDLAVSPDGTELWVTLVNVPLTKEPRRVWVVAAAGGRVLQRVDTGRDAHDIAHSPDGKQVWVTNSGYPDVPDAIVTVIDAGSRTVLEQLELGKYPFHTPKPRRDAWLVPPSTTGMWWGDRNGRALISVDRTRREQAGRIPLPGPPAHVTAGPDGTLFVAIMDPGLVVAIAPVTGRELSRAPVSHPHGLAAVPEPASPGAAQPRPAR